MHHERRGAMVQRLALLVTAAVLCVSTHVAAAGSAAAEAAAAVAGDAHDHEPVVYDLNAVRFEQSAAERARRPGDDAHSIFCTCPSELSELPALCNTVTHQCRQTFCKPLCLRMAWSPVIEADCTRAPQWEWCHVFAAQVQEAAAAVTAQFQAHVCLNNHFCNRTEALIDWVENASYGKHYPEHKLPIASCQQEPASDTRSAAAAAASASASARADVRAALCAGCERVLSVRLQLHSCVPGNAASGFETLQAGSLQERCLYVRDHISLHQHDLLTELRQRVCPCLGCCGDGLCYFPNAESAWLSDLITSVQQKVSTQLKAQGWLHDADVDAGHPYASAASPGVSATGARVRTPTPTPPRNP